MLAAFVYPTYYMWNIKNNFRGVYKDFDQVEELIRGTNEYENLETLDLETLEIKIYKWVKYYELEEAEEIVKDEYQQDCDHVLVEKWPGYGKKAEVIPFTYEYLNNTTNSKAKQKYYSGYWDRQKED